MTVVSSKEFVSNEDKYFGLAMKEQLFIRKGDNVFLVSVANDGIQKHKKPDDDFRRAITMDEFLIGVKEDLREIYKNVKK